MLIFFFVVEMDGLEVISLMMIWIVPDSHQSTDEIQVLQVQTVDCRKWRIILQ